MIQEHVFRKREIIMRGLPEAAYEANRPNAELVLRSVMAAATFNLDALNAQMPEEFDSPPWTTMLRIPYPATLFEFRAWNPEDNASLGVLFTQNDDGVAGACLLLDRNNDALIMLGVVVLDEGGLELRLPEEHTFSDADKDGLVNDFMTPVVYALTMLSCKNITVERVLPSRQERRNAERRGVALAIQHRIVVKVPGKKSYTIAGPRRPGEPVMPAHMVRGHFAEYGADKPLFGKYTGRFWIPAHVRGKREGGQDVAPKDYVVVPAEVTA